MRLTNKQFASEFFDRDVVGALYGQYKSQLIFFQILIKNTAFIKIYLNKISVTFLCLFHAVQIGIFSKYQVTTS